MKQAAVFFDIDGTLWDERGFIPESTKEGIRKLRENGHLAFICTGRSRAFVRGEGLLELGFDGIVSGCGTMIEYQDRVILYQKQEPELMHRMACLLREHKIPVIFEGRYHLYMDEAGSQDAYLTLVQQLMGKDLLSVEEHLEDMEASKFSILLEDDRYLQVLPETEPYFSALNHSGVCMEFVPKGFSKATGIQRTCELLGIDHENTYAFGDSVNDVDMLKYVAHGIVMGNGTDVAKAAGDYVTADLHEDGIYRGLEHYQLI
ncbi:MAG: Cof-type HAD-IIB family hydrolase [Roseburia sp.]